MSDCASIEADWKKLAAMIAVLENPASFAYHVGIDLLINGRDIYREISQSVVDYKAGSWGDFGFQLGEAAAKVLIGEE